MKRILFSSLVIVFVMAVCMVPAALSGPMNENKVRICHFTDEDVYPGWGHWKIGHYILVSKNACQGFVDRGDLVSSCQFGDEPCDYLWEGNVSPGNFCGWWFDRFGPFPTDQKCPE